MPIKRTKDKSQLVGMFKLMSSRKPYHFEVYVWQNQPALAANTEGMENVTSPDGRITERTLACHCPSPYWLDEAENYERPHTKPKLGEVHFTLDDWDEEIVSHELTHALLHSIRVIPPLWQEMDGEIEQEEIVCYDFGRWFSKTWKKLYQYRYPTFKPKILGNILTEMELKRATA